MTSPRWVLPQHRVLAGSEPGWVLAASRAGLAHSAGCPRLPLLCAAPRCLLSMGGPEQPAITAALLPTAPCARYPPGCGVRWRRPWWRLGCCQLALSTAWPSTCTTTVQRASRLGRMHGSRVRLPAGLVGGHLASSPTSFPSLPSQAQLLRAVADSRPQPRPAEPLRRRRPLLPAHLLAAPLQRQPPQLRHAALWVGPWARGAGGQAGGGAGPGEGGEGAPGPCCSAQNRRPRKGPAWYPAALRMHPDGARCICWRAGQGSGLPAAAWCAAGTPTARSACPCRAAASRVRCQPGSVGFLTSCGAPRP